MRIIAGTHARRRLHSPPDSATTRPIPDRVKEAVFNLLRGHFKGASVLDGFSGTGTIGLEAISRGASRVVFIERDRSVVRVLEQNIEMLDCSDRCEVVINDALGPSALARCPRPCDIIFFDPPYAMVKDAEQWARVKLQFGRLMDMLAPTGFAVLRTPSPFWHRPDGWAGEERDGGDDLDGDADRVGGDAAPSEDGARPHPVDADLSFEGAVGPETHVYKNTAVHLYMKKPASE